MLNILFLLLTLSSIALTIYYGAFYESPVLNATYYETYTYLSIGAAIIFAGLFYAGIVNREKSKPAMLFD